MRQIVIALSALSLVAGAAAPADAAPCKDKKASSSNARPSPRCAATPRVTSPSASRAAQWPPLIRLVHPLGKIPLLGFADEITEVRLGNLGEPRLFAAELAL